MIREIIKPTSEFYNIKIPKEYINQEVEILVLPFSSEKITHNRENKKADVIRKSAGIIKSKNIDPSEWQREIRGEWDDREEALNRF